MTTETSPAFDANIIGAGMSASSNSTACANSA